MPDRTIIVAVLSVLGVVAVGLVLWTGHRARHSRPLQIGPQNIRARKALADHLDRWPDDLIEGVVRWQDFASLTKHDVRELLYDRGWYYRGQDMDGDGWPLFATRDPQLAESAEPPPSRFTLLATELEAAAGTDEADVLIDMTPYQVLADEEIADAARRAGWRPGEKLPDGAAPRMTFTRS